MHYFPFHINDWRAATAHLTNSQDLTYRRLVEHYYDTEVPIPEDFAKVARRLRLDSDDVQFILEDFFYLTHEGWRHARCDREIDQYRAIADRNRQNGLKGGRPRRQEITQSEPSGNPVGSQWDASGNPVGTQSEPTGNPLESQPRTKNQEPGPKNQDPRPKNHEPEGKHTRATRFCVPTLDEVRSYCAERRNTVDPERFVDYYTANGWRVGKNPMKDWKASVRTWEKGGGGNPQHLTYAQKQAIALEEGRQSAIRMDLEAQGLLPADVVKTPEELRREEVRAELAQLQAEARRRMGVKMPGG